MNRKSSVVPVLVCFILITACFLGIVFVSYSNLSGADINISQIFSVSSGDVLEGLDDDLTALSTTTTSTAASVSITSSTSQTTTATSTVTSHKPTGPITPVMPPQGGTTTAAQAHEKRAYLTFDDGPSVNTKKLLDILDKYNVKATFFVISKKGFDKEYKDIVERGHTIALHSYSHNYKRIYASTDGYFEDLNKISEKVKELTGVETRIMRFPGGSSNTVSRKYSKGIMKKLTKAVTDAGYTYHDWNVDSGDATGNNISAKRLLKNIKSDIGVQTEIDVLMHDAGKNKNTTVEALPSIIEYLQSKGFTLLPITEDTPPVQHKANKTN